MKKQLRPDFTGIENPGTKVEGGIWMRHYDSNVWKDYVEGTIGNFDKSLMEQHMLLCDRCMEEYILTLLKLPVW
jgi:hypothetical protein